MHLKINHVLVNCSCSYCPFNTTPTSMLYNYILSFFARRQYMFFNCFIAQTVLEQADMMGK